MSMTAKKYHPESLIAVWYDLPVTGINTENGETVNFRYQDIIWEFEGLVDNCIPVCIRDEEGCFIEEINIRKDSMSLLFPDSPDDMTPLQLLALSALPFSHWHPENNDE